MLQTTNLRVTKTTSTLHVVLFILFFIILTISDSFELTAQPTLEWVARYPGPSNDLYGPFLAVDKQGNSYVAGTHVVNDTPKVLCIKYNSNGVLLWEASYIYPQPGQAYIRTSGFAIDSSGNAYVIADQGPAYYLPTNGLIVKFDNSNGSLVWVRRYIGQYGWGTFRDIKIDKLNNIYVVGWTDTSRLVIRYNTDGDSIWVRKYHPLSYSYITYVKEFLNACTIDDSLNIIFTGVRRSHYGAYNYNYDSILVGKYSPSGVLRWESVYVNNPLGNDIGKKIEADQSGNSYIGCSSTIGSSGIYLTLKYDRNGTRQWAKIYYGVPLGGDNSIYGIAMDKINNALFVTGRAIESGIGMATTIKYNVITGDSIWIKRDTGNYNRGYARDIKLDTIVNIYITGETYNFPSYIPYDILTIKYSMAGNQIWRMTYNGNFNGMDIGKAIGLDASNNVYVLGISPSSAQVYDYIVIKYNQLTGIIKTTNTIPNKFYLNNYPNPFNSQTEIDAGISHNSIIDIKIYDILGREIETLVNKQEIKAGVYKIKWNSVNFSSGIYFCRINAVYKINNINQVYINTIKLVLSK